MVTKTKRPATRPAAPIKPEVAPAEAPASEAATEPTKPNLLRAGLKALGNVRDDVVQHQSRVFEAILGIDPGKGWAGLGKRDAGEEALGLRKFEAVFDQRVAHALERMGMPSGAALQALSDEVAALKAELRSLKAAQQRKR